MLRRVLPLRLLYLNHKQIPANPSFFLRAKMQKQEKQMGFVPDSINHQSVPSSSSADRPMASNDGAIQVEQPVVSGGSEEENLGKPFIQRTQSYNDQQRRRRAASEISDLSPLTRSQSFRRDVGHAAAETFLVSSLTIKLLRYLGVGYRWIIKFLALSCYALLLMPGFLQVGYYYYFSKQVRRSVVYGDQPRNRLDLYLPFNIDEPKPVVAFITGGAWIIGYKAWGALLGQQLAERDIIVACIDYRNFPQGTISDMVKDASQGISFVCNNIAEYGGDLSRVYLIGQSAGAHIAACALLDQAIKECGEVEAPSWSVSQIKAYFGISGGIMEGEQSLQRFSPEVVAQDLGVRHAISLLPLIILLHGTKDSSIPSDSSMAFADALRKAGALVELILFEGKTHTDLFLQDPLRGGTDKLLQDILAVIHAGDAVAQASDAAAPPRRRLVPEFMLKLAHKISPF